MLMVSSPRRVRREPRAADRPGSIAIGRPAMKCLVKFMTLLALLIAVLAVVNADSIVRYVRMSRL